MPRYTFWLVTIVPATQNYGKESIVERKESFIERVVCTVERRIDESQERRRAREAELDLGREELWAEANEREKMLVRVASDEEARELSLEEITKEHQVVFVVHSEESRKALQEFAEKQPRLINVIPSSEGSQGGADIKGSWLVFE